MNGLNYGLDYFKLLSLNVNCFKGYEPVKLWARLLCALSYEPEATIVAAISRLPRACRRGG
jgi:hypothetical protein